LLSGIGFRLPQNRIYDGPEYGCSFQYGIKVQTRLAATSIFMGSLSVKTYRVFYASPLFSPVWAVYPTFGNRAIVSLREDLTIKKARKQCVCGLFLFDSQPVVAVSCLSSCKIIDFLLSKVTGKLPTYFTFYAFRLAPFFAELPICHVEFACDLIASPDLDSVE